MQEHERNITLESIEEMKEKSKAAVAVKKTTFDAKNYLNVKLDEGEASKSLRIRLLTIDKDTNYPFAHIHMHTVRVPKEVSPSGWKSYVCLEKTEGPFTEKLGNKCPFCELGRESYKRAKECKENGDENGYERYMEIAKANRATPVSVVRCIERGHEEDGPKFWKFTLRSDQRDPESMMWELFNTKIEECKEEGIEPENIFDIDKGRDFKVTINTDANNKTSISVNTFGSTKPLTTDEELREKWVGDEKVWSDVFVAKPYDYLEVIIAGGIPWYDKNSGKWIPKKVFEKNTGVNPSQVDEDRELMDVVKTKLVKESESKENNDEMELPF